MSEIIYSLNIEDIQTVAIQEMDRKLTESEIKKVQDLINKKMPWYEVISDSINELVNINAEKK